MEAFLMHRVDAARKLLAIPARAAEGTGRLFLAKRCHEAAKRGDDLATALDSIVAEVQASLSEAAQAGILKEAETIRRRLQSA